MKVETPKSAEQAIRDREVDIQRYGRMLSIDLCYPRIDEERINSIEIGLEDVRAADSILVSFDYERNGWSIKRATVFSWTIDDEECDPGWKEFAFIEANTEEEPE